MCYFGSDTTNYLYIIYNIYLQNVVKWRYRVADNTKVQLSQNCAKKFSTGVSVLHIPSINNSPDHLQDSLSFTNPTHFLPARQMGRQACHNKTNDHMTQLDMNGEDDLLCFVVRLKKYRRPWTRRNLKRL